MFVEERDIDSSKLCCTRLSHVRMLCVTKPSAQWALLIASSVQVCTTSITSASAALQVIDFPVVFIDEASMSTEPASLIPIMRGVSIP